MSLPRRACAVTGKLRFTLAALFVATSAQALEIGERRVSLNEGWRFFKGEAPGAEKPEYDDASWRALDLPHDWAIEGPFAFEHGPHQGGLPFYGVGWYRKTFVLPESARGRYLAVEFDGAMANSTVYLNGRELGGRPYGYIGFGFDLTPHLRVGGPNVLAVRLAPEPASSRWYPGAGVYRHVWLDVTGPVHVARWGTYVTTPVVTDEKATVEVRTELTNRGAAPARVVLETKVVDGEGKEVGRAATERSIPAAGTDVSTPRVVVPRPRRWDLETPHLYRVVSTVKDGARVLDSYTTRFGIRTIGFDKAAGFSLNGRRLKMQGVCNHHDLGALGAAVNRRATERQLQIMKSMGVNAIRTSHNPPSPELLDLADEMGLLVMDEAFDMWGKVKIRNGHGKYFAEWGERDLRDMIRRDRNHPSVVLWSIGNEILEQADAEGGAIARRLAAICREEDPTRPVTAGFNQAENAIRNGLAAAVDVPGFNYQARRYAQILKDHPDWTIVGAESASTVSSRGVYHLPLSKYETHPSLQVTSYDVIAPSWAYVPDAEFDVQERFPAILGEFVWTGFDYLGEPTPFYDWRKPLTDREWPARSSYFGAVDLAGFPKDRYYLYQSVWTKQPMVHVLPHWSWPGREGQAIPVVVYTNCPEAELVLNGRSLGRKKRGAEPMELPVGASVNDTGRFRSKYRMLWEVPYEAGTLEAVGWDGTRRLATKAMRTAGAPARLGLAPDRAGIAADGRDLSFVTVRVEDKDGNLCPEADTLVRFEVEGPGRIAAVDNGNPASLEPFQAASRKAFQGLALVIVRGERGKAGPVRLRAVAEGLAPAQLTLTTSR
jgi:beta-galactosidase